MIRAMNSSDNLSPIFTSIVRYCSVGILLSMLVTTFLRSISIKTFIVFAPCVVVVVVWKLRRKIADDLAELFAHNSHQYCLS